MTAEQNLRASHGPTKLVEAAANGDISEVRNILKKYPDKVDIPCNGSTALQVASQNGHAAIVRYLKQRGADVDLVDSQKNTPLHYAVNGQQVAIVKLLLEMKSNMRLENKEGQTPPQVANAKKYTECVRAFKLEDKDIRLEETKPKLLCAAQFQQKSDLINACIHGCGAKACVTFEPCKDKISCLLCSMLNEVCKKCGRKIEKISYTPHSDLMKEKILEIINMRKEFENLKGRECTICKEREIDCVLLDCYHAFCETCASNLQTSSKTQCPMCRKRITSYKRIYFS